MRVTHPGLSCPIPVLDLDGRPDVTASPLQTHVHCRTRDTGPVLPVVKPHVFCHGGPGISDFLGDLADLLTDRTTVHRWDQRGCGRSQRRGPYSVARSVADLDVVRRHTSSAQAAHWCNSAQTGSGCDSGCRAGAVLGFHSALVLT
ncbi:alpha/beta fold hydrolase [Streptomyces sp. NBC_01717]|uniref:alpha/beta fold hydrolase n=1 Tax=Streptomyces sp. NBC_01717 TaxID=2975918 RepID=UPI002E34C83C|nr:alpha/beta fold hydrolase [Streptomyces sp. NBC_01717]